MTEPIELLTTQRFLPILRTGKASDAIAAGRQLLAHGIGCLEVSLTTPDALEAIATLAQEGALIGAGTVLTAAQADAVIGAGARFIVSPGDADEVRAVCAASQVFYLPGVLTPSEIMRASRLGSHVLKLFPAGPMGLKYLKDLRGPFPTLKWVPTGGVQPSDVASWLQAGALAVGLGGSLIHPLAEIAARVADLRTALRQASQ